MVADKGVGIAHMSSNRQVLGPNLNEVGNIEEGEQAVNGFKGFAELAVEIDLIDNIEPDLDFFNRCDHTYIYGVSVENLSDILINVLNCRALVVNAILDVVVRRPMFLDIVIAAKGLAGDGLKSAGARIDLDRLLAEHHAAEKLLLHSRRHAHIHAILDPGEHKRTG